MVGRGDSAQANRPQLRRTPSVRRGSEAARNPIAYTPCWAGWPQCAASALLIHTANSGRIFSGRFIWLIHVPLPFDFALPNPMGFIPVKLGATYPAIRQADDGKPLQFPSAPAAVWLSQARHFPDGTPHGNRLTICDVANDLKVHW